MKPENTNWEHREGNTGNYVLIGAGIILMAIPIVFLIVDPLSLVMRYMSRISVGSEVYAMMQTRIPGAYVSAYVFNVTNPEAFLAGEDHKLRVKEVGPFTYQEYWKNEDFEIDERAGVMRYSPTATAVFIPERSVADPRDVNVTMGNTIMLALASMISSYSLFTRTGFNLLINQLQSQPIVDMDVYDYLWGYDDSLIALGSTLMPGWITFQKLGILDRLYDPASVPRLEVEINDADKWNVKTANGCPGLRVWQYDSPSKRSRCNSFTDAYEGFAFPSDLTPERPLRLYRNVFCRLLELKYVGTKILEYNPEAFVYEFRNDTFAADSANDCLCGEYGCTDGLTSISPCLFGFDLGLSFGHFLHAHPETYDRIDGMHPDETEHGSEFVVDPRSGIVLETRFTLQLNLIVRDVRYNAAAAPFSDMVIPLTYLKIGQPTLPEDIKHKFRLLYFVVPHVILALQIVIFAFGLTVAIYPGRRVYGKMISNKELKFITASDNNKVSVPYSERPLVEEKTQSLDEIQYKLDSS